MQARPDSLLGRGLRRLGALPVPAGATAALPHATGAPAQPAIRVAPPFGAVLELAWPEGLLAPALVRALEGACAATLAASPVLAAAPPAPLDPSLSPGLAAAMAEALADAFATPEAIALSAGPRFAAARLAALRFDAWGLTRAQSAGQRLVRCASCCSERPAGPSATPRRPVIGSAQQSTRPRLRVQKGGGPGGASSGRQ